MLATKFSSTSFITIFHGLPSSWRTSFIPLRFAIKSNNRELTQAFIGGLPKVCHGLEDYSPIYFHNNFHMSKLLCIKVLIALSQSLTQPFMTLLFKTLDLYNTQLQNYKLMLPRLTRVRV